VIDLHSHFLPDWYIDDAIRAGLHAPDGMPRWPQWDVETHLALMDRTGVDRAILSVSSPGAQFGSPEERVATSRRLNETAAALRDAHPDRFGFLATLPLSDGDASLTELARATEELGAEGAVLLTNVEGAALAAPQFIPLWSELNARASLVLLHPTSPHPTVAVPFPAPMMEFMFDTARAVAGLAFADRLRTHAPDARVVVPHVGGVIPVLLERWEGFAAMAPGQSDPARVRRTLEGLWFDLAGTPAPVQANLLVDRFGPDRIVYGSDYCFTPLPLIEAQVRALDETGIVGIDDWRQAVDRNARALLAPVDQLE
jgi:predicted TIM-barrel fold metal-dependent hydrolase